MAIQTKQDYATTSDAAGNQATLSYSYDDVSLLLTQIVIVNNSPTMGAFASGTQVSIDAQGNVTFGKTYTTTVPSLQSQTITVATNQANRLQLKVNQFNGRLDGVEWQFRLV